MRNSETRFRTMLDAAPVMIWMSDTARLCTFFNKRWLDFTGRTLEQEMGNGWSEGVHPDDFERCLNIYVSSFDAREDFTMEYRLRRRDGVYCWILDTGVPQEDADGTFLGYVGSCVDITERKHAEEKFRSVLEFLPVAILMVDRLGRIVLANEQTERLFGYRRDELSGRLATMLISQLLGGNGSTPQPETSRMAQASTLGGLAICSRGARTELSSGSRSASIQFDSKIKTPCLRSSSTEPNDMNCTGAGRNWPI